MASPQWHRHAVCRPHAQETVRTSVRSGRRACPFRHRVGGWVMHFLAVVCTSSPTMAEAYCLALTTLPPLRCCEDSLNNPLHADVTALPYPNSAGAHSRRACD